MLLVAGTTARIAAFDLRQHGPEIFSKIPGAAAFTYDRELRMRAGSGDAYRRSGVDPGVYVGQRLADVLPSWPAVKDEYEAVLADGVSRSFGCRSPEGVPYVTHISPLLTADAVIGGLVVFHDVTGQAPVDAAAGSDVTDTRAARRAEGLGLARIATWELDLDTRETRWSPESHVVYGVATDQFVADRKAFEEIVHPDDRHIVIDALERIVRDWATFEIRYRIVRPNDGAERIIRSHVRSQRDSAGHPTRLVGTGEDVTDLVLVLSPRESEVLMLLAEGLSGEEIAEKLFLSSATVRTHVHNAMVKLGAHTRGHAIATALRSGEIGS